MARKSTSPTTAGAENSQPVTRSQRCSGRFRGLPLGGAAIAAPPSAAVASGGRAEVGRVMVLQDALAGLRDGFDQPIDVGAAGDELLEL